MIPGIEGALDLINQKLRSTLAGRLTTRYDLVDLGLITSLLNAIKKELSEGVSNPFQYPLAPAHL